MNKTEILDRINDIIIDEKGEAVPITGMFMDSNLDSLGTTIALITIDAEFKIFQNEDEKDAFEKLDVANLTMRDLITLCRLSILSMPTEQKQEKDI